MPLNVRNLFGDLGFIQDNGRAGLVTRDAHLRRQPTDMRAFLGQGLRFRWPPGVADCCIDVPRSMGSPAGSIKVDLLSASFRATSLTP